MPWWDRSNPTKGYRGSWHNRLDGLFTCEVDFAGKSILDVGCNAGIIAYEVARHGAKSIHGIDIEADLVFVARTIFLGVPIDSRFETLDLAASRRLAAAIVDRYDIVLFLCLYEILREKLGAERTREIVRHLARHCGEVFVARVQARWDDELAAVMHAEGFAAAFVGAPTPPLSGRIITFRAPPEPNKEEMPRP